jgi:hypothetical protein
MKCRAPFSSSLPGLAKEMINSRDDQNARNAAEPIRPSKNWAGGSVDREFSTRFKSAH